MRIRTFISITLIHALLVPISASAAIPKAGAACAKFGATSKYAGKNFICIKSGKRLIWNVEVKIVIPTPVFTPRPDAAVIEQKEKSQINTINKIEPIAYAREVKIPKDCSINNSCPAPTPTRIMESQTCHAKVEAILQRKIGTNWVDLAAAQGWELIASCPNTNPFRPWTTASVLTGTVLRWKVYSPGQFEWYSSESTYQEAKTVSRQALELQSALTKLANEPVSTFKPTSPCQLLDATTPNRGLNVDLSAGFPKVRTRLPSIGRIKALIVPIEFSDLKGQDETLSYFTPVANGVRDFYYAQSYGQLTFDFEVVPNWVSVPFSSKKYGMGGAVGAGDPFGYRTKLIELTDGLIDYSKYDAIYYLVPKEISMEVMGWGPAITYPTWTSTGYITNGATGGADMYQVEKNGIIGGRWKWMAHETGHAFGLYDEDYKHETQSLGYWGIMAMSWSNAAIELGAWDRYLQGWLSDDQITCAEKKNLDSTGVTVTISPIVRENADIKSIMVTLSSTKILVIESRKSDGLDRLNPEQEGVLVYTVDMTIPQIMGGYKIVPRIGSKDKQAYTDAALHAADSVTVAGVIVKVISLGEKGDQVNVSKN